MKRRLVLEYRIRKLEKAILEDIDSDLDSMSNDILKRMPNGDLDAELDKEAKDIIDKEPGYFYKTDPFGYRVKTYDTIEEWLDDKTVEIQLNPTRPHKGNVAKELNGALKLLTNIITGLNYVRRLKNYVKEISDMNVLKAQQKVVNALRKRIKEVEKSNNDNKTAKDIAGTYYRTVSDWVDSMAFNNEVEAEDRVTGIKYAIMHLKGMLDDQTSSRFKDGGLDFGLYRTAEIKNDIEELRNTNVLIANQKMVSALRKKIKELESELKDIKSRKQLESLAYEGKQDQEILNDFLGDDYYNKYQTIKNRISDPEYKDIYKLVKKDPDEVKDYIDNFKSNRDLIKAAKEGSTKLYEDSDWIVYHIADYNAAKYYGRDTKWCLAGNYDGLPNGKYEFDKYNAHSDIYFYINKHKAREKYAILKSRETGEIDSIYNSSDKYLGRSLLDANIDLPYAEEIGLKMYNKEDLFDAVKECEDDVDLIEDYVDDSTINATDSKGYTPLIMAANRRLMNVVEYLIKRGAEINAKDNNGISSLAYACLKNDYDVAKLLIDNGADVNVKTKYGTLLQCTDDNEIKRLLIEHGAKT